MTKIILFVSQGLKVPLDSTSKTSTWLTWCDKIRYQFTKCHVFLILRIEKTHTNRMLVSINKISIATWQLLARLKRCSRCFRHLCGCSSLSKTSVFGWTRCEIWSWRNPLPTSFSRYKQSKSGKSSTQNLNTGINKESERSTHQRRRAYQCSCWLSIQDILSRQRSGSYNLDFQKYFESRDFIENWKWVSKGCGSYLIHPGKPLAFPPL